ncbi:MAG: GNAT family N-acetyltransferase [Bacteroidota bacterium]|nr:GNAT family N-acetyltransferase [Bacteroidota bacterium]
MLVKFIKAAETYPLRLKVLRPGGVEEDCHFANDRLEGAFHLGVHLGEERISVASFYPEKQPTLNGWKQYRLRGMATDPEHQGKGAGKRLMVFAIEHIKAQRADMLWCNARVIAIPFYEKIGFEIKGDQFEIPGIGPHFLMTLKC